MFKVLVPRYQEFNTCYTSLFYAPLPIRSFEEHNLPHRMHEFQKLNVVCVELKGHPYPKLAYSNIKPNRKHIHNVLLAEAKRDLERNTLEIH